MKILWVKVDFLHPPIQGGQIRTLQTLRCLHRRHEVHYVAYYNPLQPEGLDRADEYCSHVYPVRKPIPWRNTPAFFRQLVANLFSPLPLTVGRYESKAMKQQIAALLREHSFDVVVCDFLAAAANMPELANCVLFQHNVETLLWRRHVEHTRNPFSRAYFRMQAKRLFRFERDACRTARHVIAVSKKDAETMRELFGVSRVSEVDTGVDVEYFRRPATSSAQESDLVFVGAMHWLPNIDAARFFLREILPLVRRRFPDCSITFAGRSPTPEILAFAAQDPLIRVTGTVPDIRPYLWGSKVGVVPIRIGGGTRLKIFEAMAASVSVVSTSVGAEGLHIADSENIFLADTPECFAARCIELLANPDERERVSGNAANLVRSRYSWQHVTARFEDILLSSASPVS